EVEAQQEDVVLHQEVHLQEMEDQAQQEDVALLQEVHLLQEAEVLQAQQEDVVLLQEIAHLHQEEETALAATVLQKEDLHRCLKQNVRELLVWAEKLQAEPEEVSVAIVNLN